MNSEILAVGTEILLGDILNTNSQYLSKELAGLGISVYHQIVVGDNQQRLEKALYDSFSRADLVITTGGLGPTEDDLTKETGAKYFNKKLVLDEKALQQIEERFKRMGRTMTDNNLKQAYVPEGSIVLYNKNGTAPGIIVEANNKILVMLPGPPKETVPMFNEQVKPFLEKKQEYTFVSRVLRIADVGESAMEARVKDIIDSQTNPTIAPYAKDTESLLRITAKAKTKEEAYEIIRPVADEIYKRFGENVYSEGEALMAEVVTKMCLEKNITVAVSESCTGGLLSSAFVDYPGVSKIFKEGAVTYSNEAKISRLGVKKETLEKYGAVSAETAAEMAAGIAESAGAMVGISTTGVAGPDGGTEEKPVGLVYIGLYINGVVKTQKYNIVGNRERIRIRTVYNAMNWLRKELKQVN